MSTEQPIWGSGYKDSAFDILRGISVWGVYLHDIHHHLKVSERLPDVPAEYHQLRLLNRVLPVGIRSCNHGPLASSEKTITGHLHVEGEATTRTQSGGVPVTGRKANPGFSQRRHSA